MKQFYLAATVVMSAALMVGCGDKKKKSAPPAAKAQEEKVELKFVERVGDQVICETKQVVDKKDVCSTLQNEEVNKACAPQQRRLRFEQDCKDQTWQAQLTTKFESPARVIAGLRNLIIDKAFERAEVDKKSLYFVINGEKVAVPEDDAINGVWNITRDMVRRAYLCGLTAQGPKNCDRANSYFIKSEYWTFEANDRITVVSVLEVWNSEQSYNRQQNKPAAVVGMVLRAANPLDVIQPDSAEFYTIQAEGAETANFTEEQFIDVISQAEAGHVNDSSDVQKKVADALEAKFKLTIPNTPSQEP